ncbi:MAG: 50S ribosomal protein L13 [Candidatus Pacebacteria bacterium]|nr:50S ribosomal protein L13 [Candidatus Paceibacterota bacterium]
MQKTYMQKTADVKRDWHLVDAKDQILGRLASEIAQKLIGKNKPTYTPHIDGGDHVVVINASEIAVTGNKEETKMYYRHSGFPGGLKEKSLGDLKKTYPTRIIEKAVFNMLPKNKLRSGRMTRLKVYAGAEHKHESQIKGQK